MAFARRRVELGLEPTGQRAGCPAARAEDLFPEMFFARFRRRRFFYADGRKEGSRARRRR